MSEKILYRGNLIETEGFRVYVYGHNGLKKLVNSYDEYQFYINSGEWFDDKPEPVVITEPVIELETDPFASDAMIAEEKPKTRRK